MFAFNFPHYSGSQSGWLRSGRFLRISRWWQDANGFLGLDRFCSAHSSWFVSLKDNSCISNLDGSTPLEDGTLLFMLPSVATCDKRAGGYYCPCLTFILLVSRGASLIWQLRTPFLKCSSSWLFYGGCLCQRHWEAILSCFADLPPTMVSSTPCADEFFLLVSQPTISGLIYLSWWL